MKKQQELIDGYEVNFEPNGMGYTITIPKLVGLTSEGKNLKESRVMARDAIKCHLEGILKDKKINKKINRRIFVVN